MKRIPFSILLLALSARATFLSAAAPLSPKGTRTSQVDALLSRWDTSQTPGAAVAVIRNGEVLYRQGYGLASLEHGVPVTPLTVFDIASVSKQFGAMSILLLAQDRKLFLDDNVRKYIPELHDFGKTITLRHLLHHTSGLRDWPRTLAIAGWRIDDVISFDQIINMAIRQKTLNFEPGSEYTYSNTGYNLLAETVQRITGQSFREWTDQNIFQPLGMTSTHFHDDHLVVVKNRASSYYPDGEGGYRRAAGHLMALGSSSLFTTVEDLAKWVGNFQTALVGGPKVVRQMQQRGRLNDGTTISYAMGQSIGEYRGLQAVYHEGSWMGFRTHLIRFPRQRFAVVVLSNVSSFNAGRMARNIADIYLADELGLPAQPSRAAQRATPTRETLELSTEQLNEYAGTYYSDELGTFYRLVVQDGRLVATHRKLDDVALTPRRSDVFSGDVLRFLSVVFERDGHKHVTGFRVNSTERVRNLYFARRR